MKLATLNKILIAVAVFIVLFILGVTIGYFIVNGGILRNTYRREDPAPQRVITKSENTEESVDAYTDIGQIRIFTRSASGNGQPPDASDGAGATQELPAEDEDVNVVVVTPWFSYPSENRTLFEELSQKSLHIKAVITDYFSSMTLDEIRSKGETRIKEELLDEINKSLVMGKIRAVYFSEYVFIE